MPRDWVLEALDALVETDAREQPDSSDAVLGACRAWYSTVEGGLASKPEAGAWAARRLADRASVEAALTIWRGGAAVIDGTAARDLLVDVRAALAGARAVGASSPPSGQARTPSVSARGPCSAAVT